MAQFL